MMQRSLCAGRSFGSAQDRLLRRSEAREKASAYSVRSCRTVRDAKFSYEWAATAGRQAKDLQDTKNERVRKRMKVKGEESGDGQVMNEEFAKEFK